MAIASDIKIPPHFIAAAGSREVMMGEGNGVASVNMSTFKKIPGPHADTAWAVVG